MKASSVSPLRWLTTWPQACSRASTGLTFGTISALYGLTNGYIDQAAYTVLVTTVILSALVPTLIAGADDRLDTDASPGDDGSPEAVSSPEAEAAGDEGSP